jgi:magnesium chelatase subunit I
MKRIIAMATRFARASDDISSRSGVSVRATIANFELAEASAAQRALRAGETIAAPRVCGLDVCVEPMIGKIEFEHFGSRSNADIVRELIGAAIPRVFTASVSDAQIEAVERAFSDGYQIELSNRTSFSWIAERMGEISELAVPAPYSNDDAQASSWFEFVLEGLVQHGVLTRSSHGDTHRYAGREG